MVGFGRGGLFIKCLHIAPSSLHAHDCALKTSYRFMLTSAILQMLRHLGHLAGIRQGFGGSLRVHRGKQPNVDGEPNNVADQIALWPSVH